MLVLGAVERVGSDVRRSCAWDVDATIAGPLCEDDAPQVDAVQLASLDEEELDTDPDFVVGSYGLFLMTSANGRLQVRAMLPEQIEYVGDERVAVPPENG